MPQEGFEPPISCNDRDEVGRRRVIRWLKFLLSGREACIEAALNGAVIDGDRVAAAHIYCMRSISKEVSSSGGIATAFAESSLDDIDNRSGAECASEKPATVAVEAS